VQREIRQKTGILRLLMWKERGVTECVEEGGGDRDGRESVCVMLAYKKENRSRIKFLQ